MRPTLIEPIKKKEVKKPNMCWDIWIETMVGLELKKEVLPLLTISVGDVVPQALNARVVDAPIEIALACRQMWIREGSRNFIPAPGDAPSILRHECSQFHDHHELGSEYRGGLGSHERGEEQFLHDCCYGHECQQQSKNDSQRRHAESASIR